MCIHFAYQSGFGLAAPLQTSEGPSLSWCPRMLKASNSGRAFPLTAPIKVLASPCMHTRGGPSCLGFLSAKLWPYGV